MTWSRFLAVCAAIVALPFAVAAVRADPHLMRAEQPDIYQPAPTVTSPAPSVERVTDPATPTLEATRVGTIDTIPAPTSTWVLPPPVNVGLWNLPYAPDGLDDCEQAEFYRVQWGLPERFAQLAWRESRCINREDVRTWCCVGRWQLYVSLHLRDHRLALRYAACEVTSEFDVDGPEPWEQQRQACAARALFDVVGFDAWAVPS